MGLSWRRLKAEPTSFLPEGEGIGAFILSGQLSSILMPGCGKHSCCSTVHQRKVSSSIVSGELFLNFLQHKHFHSYTSARSFCFKAKVSHLYVCYFSGSTKSLASCSLYIHFLGQRSGSDSITASLRWGEVGIPLSVKDAEQVPCPHEGI